jgi:hypothetical protein
MCKIKGRSLRCALNFLDEERYHFFFRRPLLPLCTMKVGWGIGVERLV